MTRRAERPGGELRGVGGERGDAVEQQASVPAGKCRGGCGFRCVGPGGQPVCALFAMPHSVEGMLSQERWGRGRERRRGRAGFLCQEGAGRQPHALAAEMS